MPDTTTKTAAHLKRLPELDKGKMPAVDPVLAADLAETILKRGKPAVRELIDTLEEVDNGGDWKARFLLHRIVTLVGAPERVAQQALLAGVLLNESTGGRPAGVRVFLLSQLRLIADAAAVSKLVPLLTADGAGVADAAAAVLVSIGMPGIPAVEDALKKATGRSRDVITNAIVQIDRD